MFEPGAILREAAAEVRGMLGSGLDEIRVERVVVGLFFTGVRLSGGQGGICYTPVKSIPEAVCCSSSAEAMPASGELAGSQAGEYLDEFTPGGRRRPLRRALAIAVLNALSDQCWKQQAPAGLEREVGVNALDMIDPDPNDLVVVVGALGPYLRTLKKRGQPFRILELDPSTLKTDELPYYVPPEDAAQVLPTAGVLVATGTTLINDTLEGLLSLAREEATIVVVGPTASVWPVPFFRRKVTLLGGVSVTNADALLDVLAEGGSGYHFFGRSADQTVIHP